MVYTKEEVDNAKRIFDETYIIIELKDDYELTCSACPTIFEFKDTENNEYYFRYRNGYMSLNKNGERLYVEQTGEEYDGLCGWEDFCIHALSKHFVVMDMHVHEPSWIHSEEVDALLENYKSDEMEV